MGIYVAFSRRGFEEFAISGSNVCKSEDLQINVALVKQMH
jgi:hypothetical protein